MKEINLKEILHKVMYESDKPTIDARQILTAMKEACKQTLELAAENAKTRQMTELWSGQVYDDDPLPICIDKQSILDTINQIK